MTGAPGWLTRRLSSPDPGGAEDSHIGRRNLTVWGTALGRAAARLARRVAGWVGPYPVPALTLLGGVAVTVGLTVVSAEIYEAVTDRDGVAGFDGPVLNTAMGLRTPELNAAVNGFSRLGGPIGMPILATCAAAGLALRRRGFTPVLLVAAAATGSLMMTVAGKALIGRTRPDLADAVPPYESSASFPSGHALNAVVLAGVFAYLLLLRHRQWRARVATVTFAVAFALAMGLSRVYLGHHWLTDVLVAWTLGAAWLVVVVVAHRLYLTVRHIRAAQRPLKQAGTFP